MKVRLFVYWIIGLFAYLLIPAPQAQAVGEFYTDYDVQYAVSTTGTTIVTQHITLTNKQTTLYPERYSLTLDSIHISNIVAYDGGGTIQPVISQDQGKTSITLAFNEHVVGTGKTLSFWLRFEDRDIAQKNGNIWEITIPGVARDNDIRRYDVSLQVPSSFGANAYTMPAPGVGGKWTKEQMMHGGIAAAYGDKQYSTLTLSYYLENPTVTPKRMRVALPPDTAYQRIAIQRITPLPKTVVIDADGNYLAEYELLPAGQLEIEAVIDVTITMKPDMKFAVPLTNPADYTKSLSHWEVTHPTIAALAKKYTTPRAIYDYVVATLAYDYARVTKQPIRKGALQAIATPENSICMEFTDVFIAIARAAGIPAREAVGYAHTTNARLRPLSVTSDVLHAWPEYYDRDRHIWVPVDPTWADTTGGVNYFDKLDFDHIVLAIHGKSSELPYPAGFYRKEGSADKNVAVTFTDAAPPLPESNLVSTVVFPTSVVSGTVHKGIVRVSNTGGVVATRIPVVIQSTPSDIAMTHTIPVLPPYGYVDIPWSITLPATFATTRGRVAVTAQGQTFTHRFDIHPYTYYSLLPFIGLGVVLLLLTWYLGPLRKLWKRSKNS